MAFGEPRPRRRATARRNANTSYTLWLPITAAAGLLLLLVWFALSRSGGTPTPNTAGSSRAGAAAGVAGGGSAAPASPTASPTPTRAPIPASGCTTGKRIPAGATDETVDVGGRTRTYHLAVPQSADPNAALPLVFNFHGPGQAPGDIEGYTHVSSQGVARGYAVVTPAGVDGRWNVLRKASTGPDDVVFVEALLNNLTSRMCLDNKRVFAVGYSNGADMAMAAACWLSGRFAALVAVAASIVASDCTTPPPSVLEFHGTADPVAPYGGGGPAMAAPVEERLSQIATRLGCTEAQEWAPVTAKTKRRVWMGCRGGGDVGLIVADGGGHTWLGADARSDLGPTVSDMSATEVAFLYFIGHAAAASPRGEAGIPTATDRPRPPSTSSTPG